jgi:uncharacterized membrane protein
MMSSGRTSALAASLLLAACSAGGTDSSGETTVTAADTQSYSGIGPQETVHFTGTEPFWGGQVSGKTLTYQTPDDRAGQILTVGRFAGRNGISFSADLGGQPFVLAVTPGKCSDGMSDRAYPFTVTLQVHGGQRQGCAWSDKHPMTGAPS